MFAINKAIQFFNNIEFVPAAAPYQFNGFGKQKRELAVNIGDVPPSFKYDWLNTIRHVSLMLFPSFKPAKVAGVGKVNGGARLPVEMKVIDGIVPESVFYKKKD